MRAAQVLLARHGHDGVSMRMIAQEAGVAERTLFNIYANKDTLLARSANSRSNIIVTEAWDKAPDPGTGFFETLCRTLAEYTMADPDMARGYAPMLFSHWEQAGLHEVYCEFVGRSLETMHGEGMLSRTAVETLPPLIASNVVGVIVQWAANLVADDLIEAHMRLLMAQSILPHANGALAAWASEMAQTALAEIANASKV